MMKKLTRRSTQRVITHLWHQTLRHALQVECLLCQGASNDSLVLCHACIALLKSHHAPCSMCALPLKGRSIFNSNQQESNTLCGDCLKDPKPYQSTCAPLLYQYPVNTLIKLFKVKGQRQLTHFWVNQILAGIDTRSLVPETLVVPIPSNRNSLAQKGFSHAHLLATEIAERLQYPLKTSLICTRPHTNQKILDKAARKRNLKGLYHAPETLKGKSILLVDDVITTGATVVSASLALREAGAEHIDVCAIARTP